MPRGKVAEIQSIVKKDTMAAAIAEMYDKFKANRKTWEAEKLELRNYLFATDTTKTTNASLPWKNKTTVPKLTQIRDNLHANYMAAMFSNDFWFRWEAGDTSASLKEKRKAIESYMRNKFSLGGFYTTISQLVLDYIDYGNCIADVEFVRETHKDPKDGTEIVDYVGPKLVRHNPMDVVFNLDAVDFEHSPKITRTIRTIAELEKDVRTNPNLKFKSEAWTALKDRRVKLASFSAHDLAKACAYRVDGFGDLHQYYGSQFVEVLEFEGDLYDLETRELKENRLITIVDRSLVLRDEPLDTWQGLSTKRHCGWRERPGTLMAMGPLDNLVGMQYRIDHLENLKADVFDLIAHPVLKIKGYVKDFTWEPGARIYVGDDGEADTLKIEPTALNADLQVAQLEQKMEEMAGAPKQALGFRTPGEKTAYEVQSLESAASRIFQIKINQFEMNFVEPLMNTMLEVARRNMDVFDTIAILDDDVGVEEFLKVTREDLTARGRLRPVGSRHFAARNQFMVNFNTFATSPLFQDSAIKAHFSPKKIAEMIEDLLQLDRYSLVKTNVRIEEEMETQQLITQVQRQLAPEMQQLAMELPTPPNEQTK